MRGEFIGVWSETRREIWEPLADEETAPPDLFAELYRTLVPALRDQPSVEDLAETTTDAARSRELFLASTPRDILGERALVKALEEMHDALDDLVGDALTNPYFNLLAAFIERYSLRYDLRRPCNLCPTLPGVFASLIREIQTVASYDSHLTSLIHAFEEAIRDLRQGCTDIRIKTCIQRQVNFLEGLGIEHKGVTKRTLGAICEEVKTWPHDKLKDAMKNLYAFTCDYPGIRHGGSPANAHRGIGMRDLVAMSILLVGFTPYFTDLFDADCVYRGA